MLYCSSDCGSISLDHAVTHNLLQHACTNIMYIQRSDSKQHNALKTLSHGAAKIFLATCNAILLLKDAN